MKTGKRPEKSMIERVDTFLLRCGLQHRDSREIMRWQVLLTGGCVSVALLAGWKWVFLWFLALGAVLGVFNVWLLIRQVERVLYRNKSAGPLESIYFMLRLGFMGILLFALLLWGKAYIVAVVAGFSTILLSCVLWGIGRAFLEKQ